MLGLILILGVLVKDVEAGCSWRCNFCSSNELYCDSRRDSNCSTGDKFYCCTGSCPSQPTATPPPPTNTPKPANSCVDAGGTCCSIGYTCTGTESSTSIWGCGTGNKCCWGSCFLPTNTPAPSPTDPDIPSPTGPQGLSCAGEPSPAYFCLKKICKDNPACSATCINGVCYTTNITPVPGEPTVVPCETWGAWLPCTEGTSSNAAACASTNYYYTVRFCQSPASSTQYQIACCYPQVTGPTGGGSTPPPATPILCNQLYYCRLSNYQCSQTTAALGYDINSFQQCLSGGSLGNLCSTNLNLYLPNQTSGVCYSSQAQCQQACDTLKPNGWVKIKEGSFVSKNSLVQKIPILPIAYDSDDSANPYFLIGDNQSDGVVLAPLINLTLSNPNGKTSSREYYDQYTPTNSFSISGLINYLKSRKEVKTINNLTEITTDGIYQIDNITIDSIPTVFNQYSLLIIVNNQVNINVDFNPTKSISIVSETINFSSSVTQAKGVFIGNTINTGSTVNQGLKIIGNLVVINSLNNQRQWTDPNKPAIFIIYKPQMYLDLLLYLSTAYYDWRQVE